MIITFIYKIFNKKMKIKVINRSIGHFNKTQMYSLYIILFLIWIVPLSILIYYENIKINRANNILNTIFTLIILFLFLIRAPKNSIYYLTSSFYVHDCLVKLYNLSNFYNLNTMLNNILLIALLSYYENINISKHIYNIFMLSQLSSLPFFVVYEFKKRNYNSPIFIWLLTVVETGILFWLRIMFGGYILFGNLL